MSTNRVSFFGRSPNFQVFSIRSSDFNFIQMLSEHQFVITGISLVSFQFPFTRVATRKIQSIHQTRHVTPKNPYHHRCAQEGFSYPFLSGRGVACPKGNLISIFQGFWCPKGLLPGCFLVSGKKVRFQGCVDEDKEDKLGVIGRRRRGRESERSSVGAQCQSIGRYNQPRMKLLSIASHCSGNPFLFVFVWFLNNVL